MRKYQKLFLENNKKLLLKFDGCRDEQFYTVGLIDLNDGMNNKMVDTENLIESITNIILSENIEFDEICSTLDYFIKLNSKINNKIKEQLIFSFSIEYSPSLNIEIYLQVQNKTNDSFLLKRFDSDIECERYIEEFINKYVESNK